MRNTSGELAEKAVRNLMEEAGVRFDVVCPASADARGGGFEFRLPESGTTLFFGHHPGLTPAQVRTLRQGLSAGQRPKTQVGVVVRRLSRALLDACRQEGIAVCDLYGNAWLRLPDVYIERWRPVPREDRRSSGTVFTAKASRIVRACLACHPADWTQAQLARETGVSKGYVSTLVSRLAEAGYVSERSGLLHIEDPDRLLDDWLAHYRFDRHRKRSYAVSTGDYEAGLRKAGEQLSSRGIRFSFTGWTGAYLRAAYAAPASIMAYADAFPDGSNVLFPVERDGTLVLLLPHDPGVFQFTTATAFGDVVADAQLYLDLSRMPGRAREQADALRHTRLDFGRRS